jgi:hypothetical protein
MLCSHHKLPSIASGMKLMVARGEFVDLQEDLRALRYLQ